MCHQYKQVKLFGSICYTVKKNLQKKKGKFEISHMIKTSLDEQRKNVRKTFHRLYT